MGFRDIARSLRPGNDRELAKQYDGKSATETAAAARRRGHRARVFRDGDQAGQRFRGRRDWT
jgi:hypothetical protein